MRTMEMSLILGALALAAVPARAQSRALPSVTRVQYGVTYGPCVERPMPQTDGSAERMPVDDGCVRPPAEPPIVQPVPLPCPEEGCGAAPRRPDPDPCWYDDCPRGEGWEGRWRIQKEALRGGDFSARQNALNALFDSMTAKAAGGGAVFAGSGGERLPAAAGLASYTPASVRPKTSAASVPNPRQARIVLASDDTDANPMRYDNTTREAGTWGAGGALAGSSGGAVGAALGGAGGAVSGAASGYSADLKEKQERDEDTYRRGTDAWERTHEDHLRRRQKDDE